MGYKKPEIGNKFNDLIVVNVDSNKGKYHVICQCVCGKRMHVSMYHLFSGNTKSCRCQRSKIENKGQGYVSIKDSYSTYKRNALNRLLKFSLSFAEFTDLIKMNCHYCGSEPQSFNKYLNKNGEQKRVNKRYKESTILLAETKINGIDRKNNTQGYTTNNSVPCCLICNRAKNNMGYEEFLSWIGRVKQT